MLDFKRRPGTSLFLALLTLGGCGQRPDPGSSGDAKSGAAAQPGPAEARLALDVPPGLAVTVDGQPRGNAPLEPLVVAPGKHAVEVDGPCGKASASVEVAAGALTTVSAQEFAGLKVAQLSVVARTSAQKPVNPAVFLGDWAVPGAAGQPTAIPACKLRLRLTADGLGGFMEDIEFEAGKSYVREVVLAPGSDMIRIAGGHFRMGPPGPPHYDPKFDIHEAYEDFEGWPHIKTYEVDVPTFDLDRTEVTAEQFHACYEAGFCVDDPVLAGGTRITDDRQACSIEVFQEKKAPKAGREKHPANCVAGWEAKKYCEWVGKRLPLDVEWEFAARSRNSEYACSWGGGYSPKVKCDRSGFTIEQGTRESCSFPKDNTEQGLCDMIGGVSELVTRAAVPGRAALSDCDFNTTGRGPAWGGSSAPFEGGEQCLDMHQSVYSGFRCARDVSAAPSQR
ncbi:SUMF1/EgtB/PvdO family nonheme iron enzyme [Nannocystis punicea]|uniref:SUMF1/EgtB/PvdO family nonheme iron enzyme n=1 Tax=Nannocystis punicea TaxID=2995304 RepID=A0ABY7GVC6_9BACT|nr:SUMF1/EgtB/PvdO family nonheme iron enzyme [Nannocystis poenicansa]WAS90906.1 SUMF1/EgtB/PvdO family nonheme iron enzyme [Nannocystis poenicansa]